MFWEKQKKNTYYNRITWKKYDKFGWERRKYYYRFVFTTIYFRFGIVVPIHRFFRGRTDKLHKNILEEIEWNVEEAGWWGVGMNGA